jgi:hypothetical protein
VVQTKAILSETSSYSCKQSPAPQSIKAMSELVVNAVTWVSFILTKLSFIVILAALLKSVPLAKWEQQLLISVCHQE